MLLKNTFRLNKGKPEMTSNDTFMKKVSPQLGLSFSDDKFVKTGDGYVGCIYIYEYPSQVFENWLNEITAALNTSIVSIDIRPQNVNTVKNNISKSMEEQDGRFRTAKTHSEAIDAQERFDELKEMYNEVSRYGKVMMEICIRLYVPGGTLWECDKNVRELITELDSYKGGICLYESKNDYEALFNPLSVQNVGIYKKSLQSVPSETLAKGNPFHFSKLTDPEGFYWGETDTGGPVFLNLFHNDRQKRLSYNSLLCGIMGSGKSSALKKMIMDRAIRGDYIRVFDVTGEYRTLVETLGGRVVSFDGIGDEMINTLQILPSGETNSISFTKHMSKLSTIYSALRPSADEVEINTFERLLSEFYYSWGILDSDGDLKINLFDYDAKKFPLWSDLRNMLFEKKKNCENQDIEYERIVNIYETANNLCEIYGNVFNGHTAISNIFHEPIICFDLSNLVEMKPTILDAQIISILNLVWSDAVVRGSREKELFESGEKESIDIIRTLIIGDETHRWINATKEKLVLMMCQMFREARKWFAGISLASQQLSDWVPDNISDFSLQNIKNLFDLSTYKFILLQDGSLKQKYIDVFGNTFTEREIENVPTLEQGECILAIQGGQNIQFKIHISEEELELFSGGM